MGGRTVVTTSQLSSVVETMTIDQHDKLLDYVKKKIAPEQGKKGEVINSVDIGITTLDEIDYSVDEFISEAYTQAHVEYTEIFPGDILKLFDASIYLEVRQYLKK